ncbi:MAG: acetyltransferase [Cytophagales bacterium]|nr:acetyltransferase [Cytophagales bacterium]
MLRLYTDSAVTFAKQVPGLGEIRLRPLDLENDMRTIHGWVIQPYAVYWGMQEFSLEQVKQAHKELLTRDQYEIYLGLLNGNTIFMMERYKASEDMIGQFYEVQPGDYGMHILVAPAQKRIPDFTWNVFSAVMDFMFSHPHTDRVVVEPDVRNEKIHVLNRRAGFQYQGNIKLPGKTASLAWCTRADYLAALENLK